MGIEHVRNDLSDVRPSASSFGVARARDVAAWHETFPGYRPTPLVSLGALAHDLGIAGFYVKDESARFGLNAFKVLGGSYAMAKCIAQRLGVPVEELPFDVLTSPDVGKRLGDVTFVTTTDGNHGRGVAWTAAQLGQKAVVYMPRGSAQERLENIRALGAEASILNLGYDDAVRYAAEAAHKNGWLLVQDTSWDGYEDIPRWIMEGYTTLAFEACQQMEKLGVCPTHVFLQAGVGAMSGAVTGFLADRYASAPPVVSIVEPEGANCMFRTARAGDGELHTVPGELDTIMAGLSCGEPCSLGWDVLRNHASHFFSVPDWVAAEGMRALARPHAGDTGVESGESGAVTTGLALELLSDPDLADMRDELGLSADSVVFCVSTEGATDAALYRSIVEEGAYPRPCEHGSVRTQEA